MKTIRALVPLALAACSSPSHPSLIRRRKRSLATRAQIGARRGRRPPPTTGGFKPPLSTSEVGCAVRSRRPGHRAMGRLRPRGCTHVDSTRDAPRAQSPAPCPAGGAACSLGAGGGGLRRAGPGGPPGARPAASLLGGEPCLVLPTTSVRGCAVDDRLLHCETAIHHGPPAAACQPYLKRLLHLEWFTASDTLSAACTSAREYLVRPELLPRSGAGQPLVPLVVRAIPSEVRYPNEGLVMTFIEEGGRLWLHELAPAEISR